MCTYLKNMEGKKPKDLKNKSFDSIQFMFDRAFKRVNTFVDFRTDLVEAELQSLMEVIPDEEEVAIDVVPLATKPPTIVDWKIHKEGKKSYYQIVRADGKTQMYRDFSLMLKSFSREDLEDLYKLNILVKWHISFLNFSQNSLRINEVFGSILLVIMELLMKKLDDFGDKYQVYGRIVGIKSLFNVVNIIVALIDVNVAQSKLALLENFNENYSKCLRLLVKLQLPVQSYYC
ncbi:hypothetical protein Tco_0213665 [Tanacetum coccineum]